MFHHVLVPLDGASESESVLPQLRRLALTGASRITLFRVEAPVAVDHLSLANDAALERARRYLFDVKRGLADLPVRCRVIAQIGSTVQAILDVAARRKVSLILMAARRTTAISRLLYGSVFREVLRSSPVPVLAVPPAWSYDLAPTLPPELQPVRRILLPLAFEEESLDVLPAALELATHFGASLRILHVDPPDAARAGLDCAEVRGRMAERIHEATEAATAAGLDSQIRTATGEVVPSILAACREDRIDMIAMATHGRGGFARWLSGSTTEDLLRETNLPTLVVRCAVTARTRRREALPQASRA